jgi:hypothetical protein
MSYDTHVTGVFALTPSLLPEPGEALSRQLRSWRVSPNGQLLYLPSDADEPCAIGQLQRACQLLAEAGIKINGTGTWTSEDESSGALRVADGIVDYDTPEDSDDNNQTL